MKKTKCEISLSSVKDLFTILDRRNPCWTEVGSWESDWVFRGHSSSKWELLPSSWRKNDLPSTRSITLHRIMAEALFKSEVLEQIERNRNINEYDRNFIVYAFSQARAEQFLVNEFANLADKIGIKIPNYKSSINALIGPNEVSNLPLANGFSRYNDIHAIAQHHGIPTIGLDWTFDPLIALHFACSSNDDDHNGEDFAIWAIHQKKINEGIDNQTLNGQLDKISFKTYSYSENQFLRNQKGLFSYHNFGSSYYAKYGAWPLIGGALEVTNEFSESDVLRKITIPYSEKYNLIRQLWLCDITKAHLMPTLDNVSKSIIQRYSEEQLNNDYMEFQRIT